MKLKKRLRTLIILAAITLVLGSAGLVVRNIFLNQLKGQIQNLVGFRELRLSVFPPSLVITDVRSISTSPFFSAKKVTVTISLKSLLTKNRPISTVIEDPVLYIYAYSSDKKADSGGIAAALPFAVDQAWIKNGELFVWGNDYRIHSEKVNALFRRRQNHFYIRAVGDDNRVEMDSFPEPLTGQVNLTCTVKDKQVDIKKLRISGSGNYINASGTVMDLFHPEIRLQTSFRMRTDLLAALFDIPFSWEGKMEGKGLATREDGRVKVAADLKGGDIRINQVPLEGMTGTLNFQQKGVSTVDLSFFRGSSAREQVQVSFAGKRVWGYAGGLHLDPIMKDRGVQVPWPVRSPVWGNFNVEKKIITAEGEFRDSMEEPISDDRFPIHGQFLFWNQGKKFSFSSENLSSTSFESRIDAEGHVGRNLDVGIFGLVKDVKEARKLASVILDRSFDIPEIRGRGRGDIRIFGDYYNPTVRFDVALAPGGFDRFDASYVEGTAELLGGDFNGKFRVEDISYVGDIDVSARPGEIRADIRMVRGLVEDILPLLEVELPLRGQTSGEFVYRDNAEGEVFSGDFRAGRFSFAGQPLTGVSGKLVNTEGKIFFPELRFVFHGGDVSGSGTLDSTAGEYFIDAKAEGIDLSVFYPGLKGFLAFDLQGGGLMGQDKAGGSFEIRDLLFPPFQPTSVRGKVDVGFDYEQMLSLIHI